MLYCVKQETPPVVMTQRSYRRLTAIGPLEKNLTERRFSEVATEVCEAKGVLAKVVYIVGRYSSFRRI